MKCPQIDVEKCFDEVVESRGGGDIILRDHISKSPVYANADYVFHAAKVIAELKCLRKDPFEREETQGKINAVVERFLSDGRITSEDVDSGDLANFPAEFQNEFYKLMSHSIKSRISKANKQIRETKRNLELPSYSGMLIIANDGFFSISPAIFVHCIVRCFNGGSFEEIKAFVFLTANVYATVESVPAPALFWFPMNLVAPPVIDEAFIKSLRDSWFHMVDKTLKGNGSRHDINGKDMGAFFKAKAIPKA